MCQAVTVHAQLPEDVCTQVCMSCVCVCICARVAGEHVHTGGLLICMCDWQVALSASVCSFVCFHVVKCEWHFGCFFCVLFDYLQWRAECVCCLQEERGRQGALAAQASPSVSLPPLAPSAFAEVVTRRQTAKWQNAAPRATRNIASQEQAPSVGQKPA